MPDTERRWPGYRQDGEAARLRQERETEQRVKARNLEGRMRAADPVQRGQIDRSTGRTFADGLASGFYDDDRRLAGYREMCERFRLERQSFRWRQVRIQGRMGRN